MIHRRNDYDRYGTPEKPWKTLAYAQKNADADVTGVVVRGAFDVAKGFAFAPGWSYTGFGTATVFDNKGGELAVKMNSFYRPVTTSLNELRFSLT